MLVPDWELLDPWQVDSQFMQEEVQEIASSQYSHVTVATLSCSLSRRCGGHPLLGEVLAGHPECL